MIQVEQSEPNQILERENSDSHSEVHSDGSLQLLKDVQILGRKGGDMLDNHGELISPTGIHFGGEYDQDGGMFDDHLLGEESPASEGRSPRSLSHHSSE